MPAYPEQSPQLTVSALLRQPEIISRDLVNLTAKRFVADRLFVRGTPDQVAGGAMQYQEDESIYVDRDPEQQATRGFWPRAGWTEAIKTAAVKEYGLEVLVNYLSIRRNQRPQLVIAQRKLANNIVRFVDKQAFSLLESNTDVTVQASAAVWTNPATDIPAEIEKAQESIETQDNGYNGFFGATLVLHTRRRDDLLNNTKLLDRLPRETQNSQIQTGQTAPFLGLSQILFSSQITETVAFVLDTGVAGVIADERPAPEEGFVAYDPGPGFAPIYVKVYDEVNGRDKVVSGGRWPAMALIAPKAVVKITGIA